MALEADYDVDLFAEMARSGKRASREPAGPADASESDTAVKEADVAKPVATPVR